ncbi:anti-sigma B factor antagonist [Methanomicrobium sp. W14]|uniref:STAS domain-containing protein n=1 Tax=Methanomicrobium sp. W14 TaxID=2817839 RepID=UPI001AE5914F|nr:STAS domain-containing protein [Methanomicrobium sp. W14]MBP2132484.1 anti-sigma B factor antagonist [Methanomicrobium sp. W14]
MQVEYSDKNSVTIVRISGRFDGGSSPQAEADLNNIISEGKNRILVDLSGVDYISSSGLRVLLSAMKKIKPLGGKIKCFALTSFVSEIFEMTGFSQIFEVYEDEEKALSSFS